MPTKCLKVENLFDIVKRIIIGLEEIGFQVLSIITNNNAINKKSYIFLLQSPDSIQSDPICTLQKPCNTM